MKPTNLATLHGLGCTLMAVAALSWSAAVSGAPETKDLSGTKDLSETRDLAADDADLVGVIVGAKASYILALEEGEETNLAGAGAFIETALIPHWVEAELSARIVGGPDMRIPVDVLFKMPFHVHDGHIFAGAGPTAILHHGHWVFGGVATLGVLYWMTPLVGFVGEINYNLVSEHGAVSEFGLNIGAAYHL